MARISPFEGSCTITVPALEPVCAMAAASSLSAMNWMFSSRVRTTLEPATGVLSLLSYQRLFASARISMRPGLLRMRSSSAYSMPPDALLVNVHVAQHGSGEVSLGIKALILRLKIDAAEIERLNAGHGFRRQLAGDPYKRARGSQASFHLVGRNAQNAAEQPRHHLRIGNLRAARQSRSSPPRSWPARAGCGRRYPRAWG